MIQLQTPAQLAKRLYRIRCWWRGYHCEMMNTPTFRYDAGGWCVYCGKVNDGINHNDEQWAMQKRDLK